jgi:hypothetical protein
MGTGAGVGGISVAVGIGVFVGFGVTVLVGSGKAVLVGTGVAVAASAPPLHAKTIHATSNMNVTCLSVIL